MKNVADIYALAPLQQLMLAQALSGRDAGLLVEQFHCSLRGTLDASMLHAACRTAIARNPLLRVALAWEGLKKPVQIVRERVETPWRELDWRDLATDELESRFALFLETDRRQGFDLTKAPLVRFTLVRIATNQWRFVWTCHHLVLDGWSAGVVLKQIFQSYAALRSGGVVDVLPAAGLANYLKWLAVQSSGDAEQFWSKTLHGVASARRLPIERPRDEQLRCEPGHRETIRRLSNDATVQLNRVASQNRVGLSSIIQAAWAVLLAHYSGKADVVCGIAVSGRPSQVPQIENIVAPLVNNVPLRIRIDWDDTLPEILARLQRMQVEIQPYEYCPLQQIARAAGVPAGRQLFDTLVVVENYPLGSSGSARIGELEICDFHGTVTSSYPLTLIAMPGTALELRVLYDVQRFDDACAARLLEQLVVLLEGMLEQPQACIRDLAIVRAADHAGSELSAADQFDEIVLDCFGRPAPVGLPGEVWVGGEPRRSTGYRGVRVADGTIEWRGRSDTGVIVENYGVDPREVTAILRLHPFVHSAIVVPRVDQQGEQQLAAFVVPAPDARTAIESGQHGLLIEQLRAYLADRLPKRIVPRIWRTLDALPTDPLGEVDELRLPAAFRPRGDRPQYVAPRDPLEARLCGLWSELLGIEPVGIEDDFVELGGHSSLAVALATRLEEEFGRRLPLASLYEQRTVAQLAELLRRAPGAPEEASLVPIRESGERPPLFCIHPAGGTVMCYVELTRHLDPDIPVYGLQAAGLDGIVPPLDSVPAMATAYVGAMRRVQPVGPYHVCGWSTGGIIAFEIARQLAEAGEDVPLVALFDAAIPREGEQYDETDLTSLLGLLFPDEDLSGIRELDREQQLAMFQQRAERAQLLFAGASASQVGRIYEVFQANMKAVVEYRPGPLDQRLTLVRAAGNATPMHADPLLGWGPWAAGGVDAHDVSCGHLEMFQQPGVAEVASVLGACLANHTVTSSAAR